MMVIIMKWAVPLLCCLSAAYGAELIAGRTVYLMPMGRGLDQFIANRLTRTHVLQVVADPAKADVIFTDQVGAALEERLKELNPPPPDPEAEKKREAKAAAAKEAAAQRRSDGSMASVPPPSLMADTVNKADKVGTMGGYGRGRGTVFLVDVKSGQVLWSAFEKPKNATAHELDHTAERVVKMLQQDLTPKTK
jgi:hypothetical protein